MSTDGEQNPHRCSDNNCVLLVPGTPKGVGTNGGCKCLTSMDIHDNEATVAGACDPGDCTARDGSPHTGGYGRHLPQVMWEIKSFLSLGRQDADEFAMMQARSIAGCSARLDRLVAEADLWASTERSCCQVSAAGGSS
jgi:hypothetical protein